MLKNVFIILILNKKIRMAIVKLNNVKSVTIVNFASDI